MLKLMDVDKRYTRDGRAVDALAGVSLAVEAGEFLAVQGASGSGKSTLLLVAGGLLRPDGGRVDVGGFDPYRVGPEQRARWRAGNVGFVFQQFHLVDYLSVRENVLAASLAGGDGKVGQRAEELIGRFCLADRASHTPAELSTGERQRTALARALLNRPSLLLADEPTGNLDEANASAVLESLRRFTTDGGAVLLVTHDPRAASAADRTVHLDAGRLLVPRTEGM
ncbi:MAG: ABC transporter ATP-binding protein [Planctomycetota bacterium]